MRVKTVTSETRPPQTAKQAGFTLLEAMVAMAILSVVVLHFLGQRTEAMIDASEARNWRLAREFAQEYLSELEAGAREMPPENRLIHQIEKYPGFSFQFAIGESSISDVEGSLAGSYDDDAPEGVSSRSNRLEWQRERNTLRKAKSQGQSYMEYTDSLVDEELEEKAPSETEFEEVAVIVYFPNVRPSETDSNPESNFMLRRRISTMALQGLTPEQAEVVSESMGEGSAGGSTGSEGSGTGMLPSTGGDR